MNADSDARQRMAAFQDGGGSVGGDISVQRFHLAGTEPEANFTRRQQGELFGRQHGLVRGHKHITLLRPGR